MNKNKAANILFCSMKFCILGNEFLFLTLALPETLSQETDLFPSRQNAFIG